MIDDSEGSKQCLFLPKGELNTKNSAREQFCMVEFLVFDFIFNVITKTVWSSPCRAVSLSLRQSQTHLNFD